MPEIGPNLWKAPTFFFWERVFGDGRVEREFDLDTGNVYLWGPNTPDGLVQVSWRPVTPDLAHKMSIFGEIGQPVIAQSVTIPVKPGDEVIIYKEVMVWDGTEVHCKICGADFLYKKGTPKSCPRCKTLVMWKCTSCGSLNETQKCTHCGSEGTGKKITPFKTEPKKFDEVEYFLGIKDKFLNRFTRDRLLTEY